MNGCTDTSNVMVVNPVAAVEIVKLWMQLVQVIH